MLKKRLIPILLLNNSRMVKGVQFKNFRDTGHPVYTSTVYNSQKVDELIFLDTCPKAGSIDHLVSIIKEVSEECFVPLTIGGGIRSVDDAKRLFDAGADKISLNTGAIEDSSLIGEISSCFGSQSIVVSIDYKYINNVPLVFTESGKKNTNLNPLDYANLVMEMGAGELLITCIDYEGMRNGYDLNYLNKIATSVSIPTIANGGVGALNHFLDAFQKTPSLSAVAASSIFHFTDQSPIKVRSHLINEGIPLRKI